MLSFQCPTREAFNGPKAKASGQKMPPARAGTGRRHAIAVGNPAQPGAAATMIRSKSGVYALASPSSIVLFPAVSGSDTVSAPVVL